MRNAFIFGAALLIAACQVGELGGESQGAAGEGGASGAAGSAGVGGGAAGAGGRSGMGGELGEGGDSGAGGDGVGGDGAAGRSGLLEPWQALDLGSPQRAGTSAYDAAAARFTLSGGGADIWDETDAFHFVYRRLEGDGMIEAKVTVFEGTHASSKAGVMLRASLEPNAVNVMTEVTPTAQWMQWREAAGQTTVAVGGALTPAPRYLRLVRIGELVRAYGSQDGEAWTLVGSTQLALPAGLFVGLAVTSHDELAIAHATFEDVVVTNELPQEPQNPKNPLQPWLPARADYYVSPTGADTNDGRTIATAFRTIGKATSVVGPGQAVQVEPGTYREFVKSQPSGTAQQRIVYYSSTPLGAKLDATGKYTAWENEGDYVDIIGFEVTGSDYLGIYNRGSYSRIIGNEIHHLAVPDCTENGGAGIDHGNYAARGNDTIGNVVHHIRAPGNCPRVHGIYHANYGGRIENNIVYRTTAYGIHMWHSGTAMTIVNNLSFENDYGGLIVGGDDLAADGILVANNIFIDNRIGIYEFGKVGDNNRYVNNVVRGNTTDLLLQDGHVTTGTITSDPRFVLYDADGAGDYHLSADSPGVDAGSSESAPSYDIEGKPRTDGKIDLGPYER